MHLSFSALSSLERKPPSGSSDHTTAGRPLIVLLNPTTSLHWVLVASVTVSVNFFTNFGLTTFSGAGCIVYTGIRTGLEHKCKVVCRVGGLVHPLPTLAFGSNVSSLREQCLAENGPNPWSQPLSFKTPSCLLDEGHQCSPCLLSEYYNQSDASCEPKEHSTNGKS